MAYGNCGQKKCLVLADVGDNVENRKDITFVFIEEQEVFPTKVTPLRMVTAKYPDHAHNVEGVAMHPNGNIYILTKAIDYENNRVTAAKVFLLTKKQWQKSKLSPIELKYIGAIDLSFHLYNFNLFGRIVTGLDIHQSGTKILISTYKAAIEIELDLSLNRIQNTRSLEMGKNMVVILLKPLLQIEAISYLDAKSFIYTTEYHEQYGSSPLVKVECLD